MPNAPDLNLTKSIEYEGVDIKRSLGGADYVQINHTGTPDWRNGEPITLSHPEEQILMTICFTM